VRARWKFLQLLISLLALFAIYPIFAGQPRWANVLDGVLVLVLLTGIVATTGKWFLFSLAVVLAVTAVVLNRLYLVHHASVLGFASEAAMGLFLGVIAVRILRFVLADQRVTSDKLYGAMCVYLLIGLVWAQAYAMMQLAEPESFAGALDMAGSAGQTGDHGMRLSLAYFSFTTLTTVGYGDILARTPLARVFAMLEAVMGQLYVMTVVARLVSLQVAHSMGASKPPEATP
jgi:ion channel